MLTELEDLPRFIIRCHNLNNMRYTDDTVLMNDYEGELKKMPRESNKGKNDERTIITSKTLT